MSEVVGEQPAAPVLRIVRGLPSAEELAAVVVALAAAAPGEAAESGAAAARAHWAAPERLLREPVTPSGWWSSGLPR